MNRRTGIIAAFLGLWGAVTLGSAHAGQERAETRFSDDEENEGDPTPEKVYTSGMVTRYTCEYGDTRFWARAMPIGIMQLQGRYVREDGWPDDMARFEVVQSHGGWRTYHGATVYERLEDAEVEYHRCATAFSNQYEERVRALRAHIPERFA